MTSLDNTPHLPLTSSMEMLLFSEYNKVVREKTALEQKLHIAEQRIKDLEQSAKIASNQYEQMLRDHKETIETLRRDKAELEKKIIDLVDQVAELKRANLRLTAEVDESRSARQADKVMSIIQDFNRALELEKYVKTPLKGSLIKFRDHRNSEFHCLVDSDSICLQEYKKYEALSCLENLPSEFKGDFEYYHGQPEGFIDEVTCHIRQRLGDKNDNPNYDLSRLDHNMLRRTDKWFRCLKA